VQSARDRSNSTSGLQAMGAEIHVEHGYIHASRRGRRPQGARIVTDMVTVTGTENLMMAAVLAEGETIIENAAREPEVVDLANCLVSMGAQISGAGTDKIRIRGVERLHGASHAVMADRIETGTYLCAAAATGGNVRLTTLRPPISTRRRQTARRRLRHRRRARGDPPRGAAALKAVSVRTSPYPAFPTDMQAQFMAVNCVAEGSAVIRETIFENRFMHAVELIRLGADIKIDASNAMVTGVEHLMARRSWPPTCARRPAWSSPAWWRRARR
jgi:UDP-N-acetylglucosamine 1-carboxyvinyltransferase